MKWVLMTATLAAFAASQAAAQSTNWPRQRPITFVVPNAAGGSNDATGRAMAEAFGKQLGQSIIVDNRPGASGSIAMDFVSKSAPDGYTFVVASESVSLQPVLRKTVAWNVERDFVPVIMFGTQPIVVAPAAASARRRFSPTRAICAPMSPLADDRADGVAREEPGDEHQARVLQRHHRRIQQVPADDAPRQPFRMQVLAPECHRRPQTSGLTRCGGRSPRSACRICSAADSAMPCSASTVRPPVCGDRIAFSRPASGLSAENGSSS